MSRETGRIHLSYITDDQGGYLDNQTSRLYRFLREHTGTVYTGRQLDVDTFYQHRARNTSTRKSEINCQVDPRVEWIRHWTEDRRSEDNQVESVHCYQHQFTQGDPPGDSAKRCLEILEGTGQAVRGAGMATRYAPGQPRAWIRADRPVTAKSAQPAPGVQPASAPAYKPEDDGRLFDHRPVRPL